MAAALYEPTPGAVNADFGGDSRVTQHLAPWQDVLTVRPMTSGEIESQANVAMLDAFDRLFDRAAAKLNIQCTDEQKREARGDFEERSARALEIISHFPASTIPADVMSHMEASIDHISPAQLAGYLAAVPLAHLAQEMLRRLARQAAEQKMLEQFASLADETYGGN